MDEPARKRRKTNSPEERERSSPLKKPPRRPSFASPTKASLARNYPGLLRPTSPGVAPSSPTSRNPALARGKQARAFVLSETDVHPDLSQDVSPQVEIGTRAGAQQQKPSKAQNIMPRARRVGGRQRSGLIGAGDEEEPELPTTPSQRGLEDQDGPRRGALFSTPSKQPLRAKDGMKPSPSKSQAPPIQEAARAQPVGDGPGDDEVQIMPVKQLNPDPEIEKRKQEKARLQHELEELENQIARCIEETMKEQRRTSEKVLGSQDHHDLSDFLAKVSGSYTPEEQPAPISNLLCSFLPFSILPIPPPRTTQPSKPIPSHRPVKLADPMPCLEMFTSFKFSTQLDLPRGKVVPPARRMYQRHVVDLEGPQKLLTAQFSLVIDAAANEIIDMNIRYISSWAERELGTFIRGRAEEKDVGNACWAIDSYWDIAHKRAKYWHACEAAFAHLLVGRGSEDTENVRPQASSSKKVSRKELSRHLGRDTLILQDKHVLLKLNWRINFDWTGEASSEVNVEAAFPAVWSETETAADLKKVPNMFASLLRSKGAFEATRITTALLFAK